MKDKILEIIRDKPKHYTRIIKADSVLNEWVVNNSLIVSEHYPSMIRSAVFQEDNQCHYNNTKVLKRFSSGFQGCGPASRCKCTQENISTSVTTAKGLLSKKEKQIINDKRENTMIKKYGVKFNSQRNDVKKVLKKPKIHTDTHSKLSDYAWLKNEYVDNKRSAVDIAKEINVYYGTVIDYCKRHGFDIRQYSNYSIVEREVSEFIKSLQIDVIDNDRTVLSGSEIDIYIPYKHIGIEINGLYWHSYNPSQDKIEDKSKHLNKSRECANNGVQLIHITDYDWLNKNTAVKNILTSKLGLNQRIYARNTLIKEVNKSDEKSFLNEYHLQGWCGSTSCIGLYYNDELVGLASFRKPRFSNKYDAELLRLCFKSGISVSGGVSKLMTHSNYNQIISYTKNDLGMMSTFSNTGFRYLSVSSPGYFWTNGTTILSRYQTQKKKLENLLGDNFCSKLSEAENMFAAGFRRYWDTGNTVWLWERK